MYLIGCLGFSGFVSMFIFVFWFHTLYCYLALKLSHYVYIGGADYDPVDLFFLSYSHSCFLSLCQAVCLRPEIAPVCLY